MFGRLLLLACLLPFLDACNMAISEEPIFGQADAANLKPRDGIWIGDDPECQFESRLPEAQWPRCAVWIVVRNSKGEFLLHDAKGEAEQARFVIAKGHPPIVQTEWHDQAKEDGKTFYAFVGLDPGQIQTDGTFVTASIWIVMCGVKDPESSEIKPYPGISPECRPSSHDAVHSAALASREAAESMLRWRWLRPEAQ